MKDFFLINEILSKLMMIFDIISGKFKQKFIDVKLKLTNINQDLIDVSVII
jgi:hypothetical protein